MSRTRNALTTLALTAIAAPAAVSVWAGWVGLGALSGFGRVNLLPGIGDGLVVDTSITLPIGVEAYAAMAMGVWLGRMGDSRAQGFARASALAALALGAFGQIAYHLLVAMGADHAPLPVVVGVACMPVAVLGSAGALLHMLHAPEAVDAPAPTPEVAEPILPAEASASVPVCPDTPSPAEPVIAVPAPFRPAGERPRAGRIDVIDVISPAV